MADQRASLLFDASDGAGDPLAGGRVSVMGTLQKVPDRDAGRLRARFISRQPAAQMYAGFADFAFWQMAVERAHYVGGFGRIVDLTSAQLLDDTSGAEALLAAEPEIIAHMNADHADAIALYASGICGQEPGGGPWRMTGIDPRGIDLVNGERGVRLDFSHRVYRS